MHRPGFLRSRLSEMYTVNPGREPVRWFADAIGALVPRSGHGRVVSIHDGVINVRLAAPAALGSLLLSIVRRGTDLSDIAVLVDDAGVRGEKPLFWAPDLETRISPGTTVDIDINAIRFENRIRIVRHFARPWDGGPAPVRPVRSTRLDGTMDRLMRILETATPPEGMVQVSAGASDDASPMLRKVTRLLRDRALEQLVGLGIGFTPAGDDFLTGASFWMNRMEADRTEHDEKVPFPHPAQRQRPLPDPYRAWTPAQIRGALRRAYRRIDRTTAGGATLLWLASKNRYPAYLHAIAHHLRLGNPEKAVAIAKGHGHTSGMDALAGLVWTWSRIHPIRIENVVVGRGERSR
jgi:hypothetical protein